jgi:galactose-1-phosphate uridylyltransferase
MLLTQGAAIYPQARANPTGASAFVSIVKNYGHLVGGSLTHGHQQIMFSNLIPRRLLDDWRFLQAEEETFAAYMLRENPPSLRIRDYGPAVLLVAYFMRRPYEMLLILKDTHKSYLHALAEDEIEAVAAGWGDAIRAIRAVMPHLGRETAYNVVTHNGPGAGLYFEFLPYTQEFGGYEHLGLFVCQENPENVAGRLRDILRDGELEKG